MLSVWQVFRTNSKKWTDGYVTDSAIAFGPSADGEEIRTEKEKSYSFGS
ncbi:MAG: hypothetical protein J7L04_06480 [Bacteroidales bacterium]|nr:hypothetical protein [Bacteroidales bacterium]